MVSGGIDDYTIMELVGHLTKAMLARYTHPVTQRKQAALESFDRLVTFAPSVLTGEHKLSTRDDDEARRIRTRRNAEGIWWTARGSNS